MKKYDYLIVGSGLFGATFANKAKSFGKRCLVIDKRQHLGGNIHCENVGGINVHRYGAHIFHTSDKQIWDFVNSFVEFNRYTNSPLANYKGRLFNLPFNMNTFNQVWGVKTPEEAMAVISRQRSESHVDEPTNLEEQALSLVGRDLYEILVKGYTEKQWGRSCAELQPDIIKRIPVRFTYDNNYFNDNYQGVPVGGYNKLIDGLLEGVETRVGVDFFADRYEFESLAEKVVYTGPIDRFYDYQFGELGWRSLRFEMEVIDTPNFQGNAVVNYTDSDTPYTRVIEHKHFEMFGAGVESIRKSVVSREYPQEWRRGCEPYYPIDNEQNRRLHAAYAELAACEKSVLFGGRLAEYRYYDMDDVIRSALDASALEFQA